METAHTFNNNSKDNLEEPIDSLEQEGTATTTEEEEIEDQPVDFSQSTAKSLTNELNSLNQPRYSILSQYLKTGKLGHKNIKFDKMEDNEAASISKAAEVIQYLRLNWEFDSKNAKLCSRAWLQLGLNNLWQLCKLMAMKRTQRKLSAIP